MRADFPHTALGGSIKLSRVTPSATSEYFPGFFRLIANLPFVVACCVDFQLRPLSSTGVTWLHRYYEPLRHPRRPGLALASYRLIPKLRRSPNGASRVASGPLCMHAIAITPARSMEPIRSYRSINCGLPLKTGGSAPALNVSRPAQRLLTLWPARSPNRHRDPLHRRLQRLRCLRRCFDCYRVERTSSRAGLSPAVDRRLVTAHSFQHLTDVHDCDCAQLSIPLCWQKQVARSPIVSPAICVTNTRCRVPRHGDYLAVALLNPYRVLGVEVKNCSQRNTTIQSILHTSIARIARDAAL